VQLGAIPLDAVERVLADARIHQGRGIALRPFASLRSHASARLAITLKRAKKLYSPKFVEQVFSEVHIQYAA
jgi:hypothetical protein